MAVYEATQSTPERITNVDPREVLDYAFDFTAALSGDSDTISAYDIVLDTASVEEGDGSTVFSTPAGNVTPAATSETGNIVTAWFRFKVGTHVVSCAVTTGNNRALVRSFIVTAANK